MAAASTIGVEEFDRRFDGGEELDGFLDVGDPVVRRAGDDLKAGNQEHEEEERQWQPQRR